VGRGTGAGGSGRRDPDDANVAQRIASAPAPRRGTAVLAAARWRGARRSAGRPAPPPGGG